MARDAKELFRGGGVSLVGDSFPEFLSISGLLRCEVPCMILVRIPVKAPRRLCFVEESTTVAV